MKIIRNKSFNEFLNKYGHSYRNGKVIKISEKQNQEFIDKYGNYFYLNKKYHLDKVTLLNKRRKYYYIDNIYYQCPKVSKNGFITLVCSFALIVTGGSIGGYYLYKSLNKTTANIKSEEVKEYTEIISDTPPSVGESYKCEIKINEKGTTEGSDQRFMPATIKSVSTGGVVIPEWHKENVITLNSTVNTLSYNDVSLSSISNDAEPENYYTYTLNESRTKGNLFIKKVLGPIVFDFDLSNIKSIEKIKDPDKSTFFVNECFDPSGFKLVITDVNGVEKTIYDNDPDISYSIEKGYKFTKSDVSSKTTVTAIYANAPKTFDIAVLKDEIISLEIKKAPTKTNFLVNEAFSAPGIEVEATLRTGTKESIPSSALTFSTNIGYQFKTDDITISNPREVTVSVNNVTSSNSFSINVHDNKKMEVNSLPNKLIYKAGEKFTLEGLTMMVSDVNKGLYANMDSREPQYELDENESSIKEGYVFQESDKGKAMRIVIKHKSKTGLRNAYTKEFNVGYPIDCDNQADFEAFINNHNYRAVRLIGNDDFYHFTINGSTAEYKNCLIVGDNSNGKSAKLGVLSTASDWLIDNCFNGMNLTLSNIDLDSVIYKDNKYVRLTNDVYSRINMQNGLTGYITGTYHKVNFKNAFAMWGAYTGSADETGHNKDAYNNFFDCTFNSPNTDDFSEEKAKEHYCFYNYTGGDMNFSNCTFNAYNRALSLDMYNYGLYEILLKNCKFNLDPNHSSKSGDEVMIRLKDKTSENKAPVIVNVIDCAYTSYKNANYDIYQAKSEGDTSSLSKIFENGLCKYEKGAFTNN